MVVTAERPRRGAAALAPPGGLAVTRQAPRPTSRIHRRTKSRAPTHYGQGELYTHPAAWPSRIGEYIRLNSALRILQQPRTAQVWVPSGVDLALPATEHEIGAIALRAAYAYGRSAGLGAFDPPVGT